MRRGAFSQTAVAACALREVHRQVDAPRVFDDPLAAAVLGPRDAKLAGWSRWVHAADRRSLRVLHCARGHIVARSAYAETVLRQMVAEQSVQQYLILGAGLDSFAWRRPEWATTLPIYEIDFPATQAEKRRRMEPLGSPEPIEFVGVDFTRESLAEKLDAWPALWQQPSFVSWLGVTPYLPMEAIATTLAGLGEVLAPGSVLVMDYVGGFRPRELLRREVLGAGLMAAWVAARGEPFRYRGQSLSSQQNAWREAGWGLVELLSEADVNRRFFTSVGSPLRTIPGTGLAQLVRL